MPKASFMAKIVLKKNMWHDTCASACAFPPLRDKVVLNIIDGMTGCFDGGPSANSQFICHYNTLVVGTDPVAADCIGYDMVIAKRIEEGVQEEEKAVAGNKYVSVVFPSGSATARSKADELIRLYLPMDGKDNPSFPELLKEVSPYSGKLKFFRGPIGISGVSTSLMHYLDGISYTGVWFVADKPSKSYRALIYLKEGEDVNSFKEKVPVSDIIQCGNDFIYLTGKEPDTKAEDHGGFGF